MDAKCFFRCVRLAFAAVETKHGGMRSGILTFMAMAFTVLAASAAAMRLDLSRAESFPKGTRWVAEGPGGTPALRAERGPGAADAEGLFLAPIDLTPLRGKEVLVSADLKADSVTQPARSYEGIKCQLHFTSAEEGPKWFNIDQPPGSFDWRHGETIVRIPPDASAGQLQLGLQGSEGTAWLANVTLTILRGAPARPPRLRGVVGPKSYVPGLLPAMAAWKVNLVRWQIVNPDWPREDVPACSPAYGDWLEQKMNELALVLDEAQQLGIKVAIDLHTLPGGRLPDGTLRLAVEKPVQDYYIEVWRKIAARFRGHPAVWAYGLMNEPVQNRPSPPGVPDWWHAQKRAAEAVREIDPRTPVLIACDQWNSPEGFAWMEPVWVPGVIYEVHVYWPHEYTHQGFEKPWEQKITYPGTFNERPLDRDALARQLAPVREFQRAYGARIYVGEFSVVRWAPGADRYLSDAIALFEDYGWDWTYHAFGERSAWNLDHRNLPPESENVSPEPTDRAIAVRSWFEKNR